MAPAAGAMSDTAPLSDPVQAFRERAKRDRARTDRLMARLDGLRWRRAAQPLAELEALAHGLAGAGGTFGFPALSETAARLERRLEGWRRKAPTTLTARQIAGLRRLVERMAAELDVAAR
ncbi:MAG TPA: Hpt domain-containing protein [Alphaproteobacteria bacterium]|jgi:HPt (histidine-containing phosphotransfer) domain-containing protein